MFIIMVRNTGMWGITTACKRDGKVESYNTLEEAQKVAEERNKRMKNSFNHYFVQEEK